MISLSLRGVPDYIRSGFEVVVEALAAVLTSRVLIGCQDGIDAAVGASSDVVVVDLQSSFDDHEYDDDDDSV